MAEHENSTSVNLNAEINRDITLLHTNAAKGRTRRVNSILKSRANINAEDENKRTPLHLSAKNGHKDVAEILLKAGANIDAEDVNKKTALHLSAESGHTNVTEILIKAGANINAEDVNKKTALHLSAESGHTNVTEILIKAGANINTEDDNKSAAIRCAASNDIQQGSSSADCMTLPSSGRTANSCTDISDDTEASTLALQLGLSLQEIEDLRKQVEEYWAKFPLQHKSNSGQRSTGVTSVLKDGKIIINICPVTVQFHNEVVQNNPQQPTQFTDSENVTVNNIAYYSGTKSADSDVDTQVSDIKDNSLEYDNKEMDQKNRDLIKINFILLSRSVATAVDEICIQLWSKDIISEVTKDTILQKKSTPKEKADALLNFIMSRGPHAFEALYKSALDARLFNAADILHPDRKPHGPTVDTN